LLSTPDASMRTSVAVSSRPSPAGRIRSDVSPKVTRSVISTHSLGEGLTGGAQYSRSRSRSADGDAVRRSVGGRLDRLSGVVARELPRGVAVVRGRRPSPVGLLALARRRALVVAVTRSSTSEDTDIEGRYRGEVFEFRI